MKKSRFTEAQVAFALRQARSAVSAVLGMGPSTNSQNGRLFLKSVVSCASSLFG